VLCCDEYEYGISIAASRHFVYITVVRHTIVIIKVIERKSFINKIGNYKNYINNSPVLYTKMGFSECILQVASRVLVASEGCL